MENILAILKYLGEHHELLGFIQNIGIVLLVGMIVLPKSIDSWKHLNHHETKHEEEDTSTKLLVKQMSEQVNHCAEATRTSVHKITEATDVLLLRTEMLTKLLEVTDIKTLSTMLRKTISDVEGMVIASDHHSEKLGNVLSLSGDILHHVIELLEMHKDPGSPFATAEVEHKIDELKQLVNNAITEIIRSQK